MWDSFTPTLWTYRLRLHHVLQRLGQRFPLGVFVRLFRRLYSGEKCDQMNYHKQTFCAENALLRRHKQGVRGGMKQPAALSHASLRAANRVHHLVEHYRVVLDEGTVRNYCRTTWTTGRSPGERVERADVAQQLLGPGRQLVENRLHQTVESLPEGRKQCRLHADILNPSCQLWSQAEIEKLVGA